MREVRLVFILLFCITTINFGQIVNESFENEWPPLGWKQTGVVHKFEEPFYHPSDYGVKYIEFNSTDDWIMTKPIKNPDVLTFWIRSSTDIGNLNQLYWRLIIQTSEDGVNFSTPVAVIEENGEGGDITDVWSEFKINLNLTGTYTIRWFMEVRIDDWALVDYVNVSQTDGTSNVADHLVISEIYSRGGRTDEDATYKSDYITLYNPTASSIDISKWSVQVYDTTAAGAPQYLVIPLSNSIAPDNYYLIQLYTGSIGADLPNPPDVDTTISLRTYVGKVALVNDRREIAGKNDPNVIDFVGYSADADGIDYYGDPDEFEGFNCAYYKGANTMSIRRKDNNGNETSGTNGSGYDINDNRSDFYSEKLIVTDVSDNTNEEKDGVTPYLYNIKQNYPNPFNPSTTISYELSKTTEVSLIVYDILGNEVAILVNNEKQTAGNHSIIFNASNNGKLLSSGVYLYILTADNYSGVRKMLILK